nr:MAG TPA: hypothetical protein [Caudoviricetes sp.]
MNRYDIEKRMERSRRKFVILQGVVIAFIVVWMKWAFVFLGR